jgi:hypothetical protein
MRRAAVQAIADVRTPLGKLLTTVSVIAIADSSEGKSLVWREAQRPFADYNEWLAKEGEKIEIDYAVDLAIWKDEYDQIGQTDKMQLSKEQMREKAERMKECMKRKPKKPSFPTTTFDGGGTVEGIIRDMTGQPPTAIHSTSEGGSRSPCALHQSHAGADRPRARSRQHQHAEPRNRCECGCLQ